MYQNLVNWYKPAEENKEKKKLGKLNPSRIRDHLANERTYLAWMRTAIALLRFGVEYELTDCWVILFSLAIMVLGSGVIYYVLTTPLSPLSAIIPD